MKSEDLLDAVGGIDSAYVEKADEMPERAKKQRGSRFVQWGLAAAALLLVSGVLYHTLLPGSKPNDAVVGTESSDMPCSTGPDAAPSREEVPSTIVVSFFDSSGMILDSGILYIQTNKPYEGKIPETGIKTVTAYEGGDCMADDAGILVHDGACNFDRELKTQYFRIDDARIAVKYNGAETWVIYCDKDRYQEFYPAPSRTPEEIDPTYGLTESSTSETVSITFWD